MLRRFLSGVRWYVVNMWHWCVTHRRVGSAGSKVVYLDLRENLWHRYLHILVLFLMDQGYTVHLRHRWRFIASWASHDLFRRSGSFRLYCLREPDPGAWLITDRCTSRNHTLIDVDAFRIPGEDGQGLYVPMPMVDTRYILGLLKMPLPEAGPDRQRKVFFFGNMDRLAYTREEPSTVFGCFRRAELMDIIQRRFADHIHRPDTVAAIMADTERYIVLMDRHREYIRPKDLNGVLARFDFFLAPSGVVMPLCHNMIEAMFAGCIPILQHAHLLEPPLHDGIECLSFRDEEGLVSTLERIRSLDPATIKAMRSAVLEYCSKYLTPTAVIGSLEKLRENAGPIHLNGELASVERLRTRLDEQGIEGPLPFPARGQ
ncbi:MAG: hypothetical protein IPI81_13805 [Flavobacteriales bacterium]|nr:hypothetical protein [Flavobacteriales bacterium]MCC6937377.1 hypothetical protein [Flavobacteriales bacterium]